jgi:hypothetical protein
MAATEVDDLLRREVEHELYARGREGYEKYIKELEDSVVSAFSRPKWSTALLCHHIGYTTHMTPHGMYEFRQNHRMMCAKDPIVITCTGCREAGIAGYCAEHTVKTCSHCDARANLDRYATRREIAGFPPREEEEMPVLIDTSEEEEMPGLIDTSDMPELEDVVDE